MPHLQLCHTCEELRSHTRFSTQHQNLCIPCCHANKIYQKNKRHWKQLECRACHKSKSWRAFYSSIKCLETYSSRICKKCRCNYPIYRNKHVSPAKNTRFQMDDDGYFILHLKNDKVENTEMSIDTSSSPHLSTRAVSQDLRELALAPKNNVESMEHLVPEYYHAEFLSTLMILDDFREITLKNDAAIIETFNLEYSNAKLLDTGTFLSYSAYDAKEISLQDDAENPYDVDSFINTLLV